MLKSLYKHRNMVAVAFVAVMITVVSVAPINQQQTAGNEVDSTVAAIASQDEEGNTTFRQLLFTSMMVAKEILLNK